MHNDIFKEFCRQERENVLKPPCLIAVGSRDVDRMIGEETSRLMPMLMQALKKIDRQGGFLDDGMMGLGWRGWSRGKWRASTCHVVQINISCDMKLSSSCETLNTKLISL